MNHFHAFYDSDNYGGTIIDVNLPCPHPDATCDLPDRYVLADSYDVLHTLLRTGYASLSPGPIGTDQFWLTVDGAVLLTPEQAASIEAMFSIPTPTQEIFQP